MSRLPNLIIIGSMKSGTTSLHSYLDLHPDIGMSSPKELDFFVEEHNWCKGVEWYANHFPGNTKVAGESTPYYTQAHRFQGVPPRMKNLLPDVRLIYILRDPVARVQSHYEQLRFLGWEKRSIHEAMTDLEANDYVLTSLYYFQMEPYLKCFPLERILITTLEEMRADLQQVMNVCYDFLEVNRIECQDPSFGRISNRSIDKRPKNWLGKTLSRMPGKNAMRSLLPFSMRRVLRNLTASRYAPEEQTQLNEREKADLRDRFQPDVEKLRDLTGRKFAHWSV